MKMLDVNRAGNHLIRHLATLQGLAIATALLLTFLVPSALVSQSRDASAFTPDPGDVEITSGVSFSQVDFNFESAEDDNTTYGLAIVDHHIVEGQLDGTGNWYLNILIYDPAGYPPRWAIQNLPLVDWEVMDGVSTFFSLLPEIQALNADMGSDAPPQQRGKVQHVDYAAIASRQPKTGLPFPIPQPQRFLLPAMNIKWNAAGYIAPVNFQMPDLSALPACPAEPNGETRQKAIVLKNDQESVQQDVNQCAPASVSNSLQYLCDNGTCGDDFKKPNLTRDPGKANVPRSSRVARMDFEMSRAAGAATPSINMLLGKLYFLCRDWGMSDDKLVVQHQGKFCTPDGSTCIGENANRDFTCGAGKDKRTITSMGKGAPSIDFIANAITTDKADLELAGPFISGKQLGGHAVHVVGYVKTKGVDGIWFIHDADQRDPKKGVAYNEGGRVFVCLSPLQNGQIAMPNFPGGGDNGIITNLVEEYPK
jgi:hypothetical protein